MAMTITERTITMVKRIDYYYSSVAGTTSGQTTYKYDGKIERIAVKTTGHGGTFTLTDEDGFDLALGAGAFTSGSPTGYSYVLTTGAVCANSKLTFEVATSGDGHCYVFIR